MTEMPQVTQHSGFRCGVTRDISGAGSSVPVTDCAQSQSRYLAVNAPCLNESKSLAFSRHTLVSAQKTYQRRGSTSEMTKFGAFGLLTKNNEDKK